MVKVKSDRITNPYTRNKVIRVRVNGIELEQIEKKAKQKKIDISFLIREALREAGVIEDIKEELEK